jgi:hypothetical protein
MLGAGGTEVVTGFLAQPASSSVARIRIASFFIVIPFIFPFWEGVTGVECAAL